MACRLFNAVYKVNQTSWVYLGWWKERVLVETCIYILGIWYSNKYVFL